MLIIPAIDLKDGCVVRYVQGKLDKKVYSKDPVKTALHWVRQGAQFIHIVDLDGAFTGIPKNLGAAKEIVKNIDIPVEFGGGVRDLSTIEELLAAGVKRVVLGTKAIEEETFLKEVFGRFGEKVIISLDAKNDSLATKGWKEESTAIKLFDFACILKELGFTEVIYTDVFKDGTLSGPNIKSIKSLLKKTGLHVVASGGISTLEDIKKLKKIEKDGVTAVIIGKALYEGKFTLKEAITLG